MIPAPGDLVLTPLGLHFQGRRIPCTHGRGGIVPGAAKREGDGATPTGSHRITGMFYRPDRLPRPAPWARAIGPGDLWSDDPAAPDYNHPVRAPYSASHECLRRADPQYDIVMVIDWNRPVAVPGRGSAIFVHQWRRPGSPTAGCLAMARADLFWLAARVEPGAWLHIPAALSFGRTRGFSGG